MQQIISYHRKKGEDIPLDSEHYLYELANQKKLDESEVLKMFPGGVVAMGFGTLALESEKLRLKVKWNPADWQYSFWFSLREFNKSVPANQSHDKQLMALHLHQSPCCDQTTA